MLAQEAPGLRPAPCFPLQDFKGTCTEGSLIHPSPREGVVLAPGWTVEGLIHCGSHKSGGWVAQGSRESLSAGEPKMLLGPAAAVSEHDSGTRLQPSEAWNEGQSRAQVSSPLVLENPP